MHESPRLRRLRNDLAALERLREESSVLRYRASGRPTQHYVIEFRGKSLARSRGKVVVADRHEVEIKLGASYPRTMPEIRWMTPIYHPNISEIGMVCLGGYGTHWVPSLNLDELVGMLWDMARYHNYDVRSPYNRDAALWVANQSAFAFPLDCRPLRDLRARLGRVDPASPPAAASAGPSFFQRLMGRGNAATPAERVWSAAPDGTVEPAAEAPAPEPEPSALFEREPVAPPEPAPEPEPAAEGPRPVEVAATGPEADGLIILEAVSEPYRPPAESSWSVRLRAQDEEIVFID